MHQNGENFNNIAAILIGTCSMLKLVTGPFMIPIRPHSNTLVWTMSGLFLFYTKKLNWSGVLLSKSLILFEV